MVVSCPVNCTSSASSGAASRNSAPAIAAEADSTAVVVTAKGGALFKSIEVLYLFGIEIFIPPGVYLCGRCWDEGIWLIEV